MNVEPLRILRIYQFLPPLGGGMENHILRLSQEQRLLGCEVAIIFNQGQKSHDIDVKILPDFDLRKIRPQVIRDVIFFFAVAFAILSRKIKADVVHLHGDWSLFSVGPMLCRMAGASVKVASIHGVLRRGIWSAIYKYLLQKYSLVYCTGAGDTKYLRGMGLNVVKWRSSGIASVFFDASLIDSAKTNDIICVANFHPVKNIEFVLRIAAVLPTINFLLVGDGPLRKKYEAMCSESNLENVRFSGSMSLKNVAVQLSRSKIFLSTSFREGTPTALLEAMACGLPVITSASNDYDELIVSGINGYVIANFDLQQYVEKIRSILGDPTACSRISRRNEVDARENSWPKVAVEITDWMRSSLK